MFSQLVTTERWCEALFLSEPQVSHLKFLVFHVSILAHHLIASVCTFLP